MVNNIPLPLYPPVKRIAAYGTGGRMGSRAGQDGCGKSRPYWDSILELSSP